MEVRQVAMKVTTVRFGEQTWRHVRDEAKRDGVSVAQFVREASLLRVAYLAGERGEDPLIAKTRPATER